MISKSNRQYTAENIDFQDVGNSYYIVDYHTEQVNPQYLGIDYLPRVENISDILLLPEWIETYERCKNTKQNIFLKEVLPFKKSYLEFSCLYKPETDNYYAHIIIQIRDVGKLQSRILRYERVLRSIQVNNAVRYGSVVFGLLIAGTIFLNIASKFLSEEMRKSVSEQAKANKAMVQTLENVSNQMAVLSSVIVKQEKAIAKSNQQREVLINSLASISKENEELRIQNDQQSTELRINKWFLNDCLDKKGINLNADSLNNVMYYGNKELDSIKRHHEKIGKQFRKSIERDFKHRYSAKP